MEPNTVSLIDPVTAREPKPRLHDVVLFVDTLIVMGLYNRPLEVHRLTIGPGPEKDVFVVRATVSFPQLLKLAAWAASVDTLVTVCSPSPLRDLLALAESEPTPAESTSLSA